MIKFIFPILMVVFFAFSDAYAGDDPSIPKGEKEKGQKAMQIHINHLSGQKGFPIYDPQTKSIVHLKFKGLHSGVDKKGDYLVSCADFEDKQGTKYDVDFIVVPSGDNYEVVESVIHAKDDVKYPYEVKE